MARHANPLFDWYEVLAIVAYYGDTEKAADALDIDADIVQDALEGRNLPRRDYAELQNQVADLEDDDQEVWSQIEAIKEIFINDIPDPSLEIIVSGIAEGKGNYLELIDAWHADDGDIWADNSEFWKWFRKMYD